MSENLESEKKVQRKKTKQNKNNIKNSTEAPDKGKSNFPPNIKR